METFSVVADSSLKAKEVAFTERMEQLQNELNHMQKVHGDLKLSESSHLKSVQSMHRELESIVKKIQTAQHRKQKLLAELKQCEENISTLEEAKVVMTSKIYAAATEVERQKNDKFRSLGIGFTPEPQRLAEREPSGSLCQGSSDLNPLVGLDFSAQAQTGQNDLLGLLDAPPPRSPSFPSGAQSSSTRLLDSCGQSINSIPSCMPSTPTNLYSGFGALEAHSPFCPVNASAVDNRPAAAWNPAPPPPQACPAVQADSDPFMNLLGIRNS